MHCALFVLFIIKSRPLRLCAVLSLPNFRLPHPRSLSLSAAARRTTGAAGAGFFLVEMMELGRQAATTVCFSYRVDVDRPGCLPQRLGALRRPLSPDFSAAAPALFIP